MKALLLAIWNYVFNILLWLDEGLNVVVVGLLRVFFHKPSIRILRFTFSLPPAAGQAHYTVSQFCAEMRERGYKFGCVTCRMLTVTWGLWIKKRPYDHCTDALYLPDGTKLPESEDVG